MKPYFVFVAGAAVLALGLNIASAEPPATPPNDDETKSILLCTPESSEFRISVPGAGSPHAYAKKELFNASVLVAWSKTPNQNGDLMRTGTRLRRLHCGDVSIDVRAGFYNGNPNGELGAADDFARLTIKRGAHKVEVSLIEDVCADAQSPRAQVARGDNPVEADEGHMDTAILPIT